MTPFRATGILLMLVLILILLAGCTAFTDEKHPNVSPTHGQSVASYHATLPQPDAGSDYVKMDTDIYNIGEVVEFIVTNDGSRTLECSGNPPTFSVKFQPGRGTWATRMGTEKPNESEKSTLAPSASTQVYRFVTTGWDPGRYRIVHDCGVEREILIRSLPAAIPAATCPVNASNMTPWITIDAIDDQYAARPFTIQGTTNLPAGQEIKYTIFSVTSENTTPSPDDRDFFMTTVQEGSCSTNTWSALGEIQATGEFFIWVSDTGRNATAIKRFTVFPP